jgi:hypothetical protein
MRSPAYQLRGEDASVIVPEADLAALALAVGQTIGERELRRRASYLPNQSLAQAIHAMLDQEEPSAMFRVLQWPAPSGS